MTNEPGRHGPDPEPDETAADDQLSATPDTTAAPDRTADPGATASHEPTAADETAVVGPGPTGTELLPEVDAGDPGLPPAPTWSARAQVRPPRIEDRPAEPPADWVEVEPRRSVATPVLITATVLILLLILGIGIYLLVNAGRGAPTTPPVIPTFSTPASTSAAPRTQPATTPPPTTEPALVTMPDLSGADYDSAVEQLTALGLVARRVEETSSTVPAGRVIRTDPVASRVPPGSVIKVVVSVGPPAPPPTTATPTAPGPT